MTTSVPDVPGDVAPQRSLLPIDSDLHATRNASVLGIALGVAFTVCFVTGVISHLIQYPPDGFTWPSRPAGLYRVTQGTHVVTGFIAVPLLLAKLWVVADRFWVLPPVRDVWHAAARISLLPLVGGAVFMLVSGVLNVARWYPWAFFFPRAHFWASWVTIGGLVIHLGTKFHTTREALRRDADPEVDAGQRRAFLLGVGGSALVAGAAVIGNTFTPFSRISVLAQRRTGVGSLGLPVQKSARQAGVSELAVDPSYRLTVTGAVDRALSLSVTDLEAFDLHSAELPIACVEGWSQTASWRGVRLRDLLDAAGAPSGASVTVRSLQPRGLYRSAEVNPDHVADPDTLLALFLNGRRLDLDHGYPVRLIGPNRPGVMQTKWVTTVTVTGS